MNHQSALKPCFAPAQNCSLSILLAALCCFVVPALQAQTPPEFTGIQRLTNKETRLQLTTSPASNYRIDASTNLPAWSSLVTLTGVTTTLLHTDSAAPYLASRYYRAERLAGTNILTGDHLPTDVGDVVIHPINHASLVLKWGEKMIYNDPVGATNLYTGIPRADLILVSHEHPDHFNSTTIEGVRRPGTVIIVSQIVYNSLTAAQKTNAIVLTNTVVTNVLGMTIESVPAYNGNHPRGRGNGYVLTIGGRRIYFSGDTGDAPEIRALPNIDVAFLCMNVQFTMDVTTAASVIRAMRPKVAYPYHYSGSPPGDVGLFKRLVGTDLGIEVRLRKWY